MHAANMQLTCSSSSSTSSSSAYLRAVLVEDQHALAGGVGAPALAPADVPRVPDDKLKIVVIVDAGRDGPAGQSSVRVGLAEICG